MKGARFGMISWFANAFTTSSYCFSRVKVGLKETEEGERDMKTGTLLSPLHKVPRCLQTAIEETFPGKAVSDLVIRYYTNVEDVGYEYFQETVLLICQNEAAIRYLEPFVSYVQLGEALILSQDGLVVYEADETDRCTESGPFWLVTPKER